MCGCKSKSDFKTCRDTHIGSSNRQRFQSSEGADDLEVEHAGNPGGVSGGVPRLESAEEADQTRGVGGQPARCERHSAWFGVRTRFGQHATLTGGILLSEQITSLCSIA